VFHFLKAKIMSKMLPANFAKIDLKITAFVMLYSILPYVSGLAEYTPVSRDRFYLSDLDNFS